MSVALPWSVVEAKVAARIEDLRTQLEAAAPDAIANLQGQIASLRYVLTLPRNLPDPDHAIGDAAAD